MFSNITIRTSNLARKVLYLQNMKVELCGQESSPLYPVHIKSFASRVYCNKFYYVSLGVLFHTSSRHGYFIVNMFWLYDIFHRTSTGHYSCVAYGREDAVV